MAEEGFRATGGEFEQTPFLKVSEQRVEIDKVPAIEMVYLYREPPPVSIVAKVRIVLVVKDKIGCIINCRTSPTIYDQVNEDYFEPMIQSFKFEAPRKPLIEFIRDFLRRFVHLVFQLELT